MRLLTLLCCCAIFAFAPHPAAAQDDVELSGPVETLQTDHFILYYTLTGEDASTPAYAAAAAEALELAYQVQIVELGWAVPPSPNGRYPVYLMDALDREDALGVTTPLDRVGDNPNTPEIEGYASTSALLVENDMAEADLADGQTAIGVMRATVAHEFNHGVQFGYDDADAHDWIYEATATWMETQTVGVDQDATGYVYDNFQYPEVCFGSTQSAEDRAYHYGAWLLMDHLAQTYGPDAVRAIWEESRELEGFAAVEAALARYAGTPKRGPARQTPPTPAPIPSGNLGNRAGSSAPVAGQADPQPTRTPGTSTFGNLGIRPNPSGSRPGTPMPTTRGTSSDLVDLLRDYHLRNLARDYALAPEFEATVWLEGTIASADYRYTGIGAAELGANYFRLDLAPGTYTIDAVAESALTLWLAEVDGGAITVYAAADGVQVRRGIETYLMVFNPAYDENLSRCESVAYDLDIRPAGSAPAAAPMARFDARYFETLANQ